ncbi:hypothetical protein [Actinacidiphila sp. bgisy144]|uniref:hypothetical protein n=1 Tax=Actinacidiphila sp. bgisy144 TaxID=3413791 RepID=UPI003EC10959
MKKKIASLGVAATAAAGILMMPGTAQASSGGGCTSAWADDGDQVSACISASGSNLEPDGYVIDASVCTTAHVLLADETTKTLVLDYNVGCGTGHVGPFAYKGVNGHKYQSEVYIEESNIQIVSAASPVETLSY